MKAIYFSEHGRPNLVCDRVEVVDPGAPAVDEVVVEVQAAAINPADLLAIEGRDPGPPELRDQIGIECAGCIVKIGSPMREGRGGKVLLTPN